MGKYMRRKCGRGGAAGGSSKASAPAVVLGPRTRSRAAVAVSESEEANPAKRRKQASADEALSGGGDASAGCYLHLRSRRLFMPATTAAVADEEASAARRADSLAAPSGEAVAAGISRCSSTASSTVDVAARERSDGEAEARENADVESSVSDSSERGGRESLGRETTPSSRPPVDCGDLESNQAEATDEQTKRKRRRSPATTTTTTTAFHLQSRLRMPAEEEIDEFFAAAEKAQAQRFAVKYNFDVALGLPLNSGRFEWTPVATV